MSDKGAVKNPLPTRNIVTMLTTGMLVVANVLYFFGAQNQQSAYMMTSVITLGLYMLFTAFSAINFLPDLGLGSGGERKQNTAHVLVAMFGSLVMSVASGVLVLLQNMYAKQISVRFSEGSKTGRAGEVTNKIRIYAILSLIALLAISVPIIVYSIDKRVIWGTSAVSVGMFVGMGIMLHKIQRTLANTTDG
jgi:hypothetical protein